MKTIALRFGESFSPDCGTIAAHQKIIDSLGFVWYGKLGSSISKVIIDELLQTENLQILLINSGKTKMYWAHCTEISRIKPSAEEYPSYYGNKVNAMSIWFKITAFKAAEKDVISKCTVVSSGKSLSDASKCSINPYFIIEYKEDEK